MIEGSWNLGPTGDGEATDEQATQTPINLTVLRSDLRRRWRMWTGLAAVGGLMGLVAFVAVPPSSSATTRLLLAHPPNSDPTLAMQTDLALATTREVAQRVISVQGLTLTPDEFLDGVTATPTTTQILTLTVAAPDQAQALARTSALASEYLDFRAEQVSRQTEAVITGTRAQVEDLSQQIESLSDRISVLQGSSTPVGQARLDDLITERAELASQVSELNRTIQADTLLIDAVSQGSRVLDTATINPPHTKRTVVLLVASGVVAGLALGAGIVVLSAIVSDRPRRRVDIAGAIGVPVVMSVGRVRGRGKDVRRARAQVAGKLAAEIEHVGGTSSRWALLSVGSSRDIEVVAASLVTQLAAAGTSVEVVDLTESGTLESVVADGSVDDESAGQVTYVRPSEVPTLATPPPVLRTQGGPRELVIERVGAREVTMTASTRSPAGSAEVSIVVGEVTPAIGADHLVGWADQAAVVLTAGGASAERLRAAGELVRASGLPLHCAVLTRCDAADDSLGLVVASDPDEDARSGKAASGR